MKILPIISISHLYFANIYKDFSLNIPANTNFAICGENGTGKTSLIKILCDLLTLDKGSVVFRGMNKNHKTIGYCSQHTT
jgi:ABC-type Mn2+/Zn2+ transport system ATPase subunit